MIEQLGMDVYAEELDMLKTGEDMAWIRYDLLILEKIRFDLWFRKHMD